MRLSIWLFLVTFALVFYNLGASFIESFVNYPTWRLIGANEFRAYHQAVGPLYISYGVAPGVLATVLTLLLLYFRPIVAPRNAFALAVAALLAAVERGLFGDGGWEFIGIGERFDPIPLGRGYTFTMTSQ